ncbi:MAG: hypothetical protein R6X18_01935 [Chloroflexota bacterium]
MWGQVNEQTAPGQKALLGVLAQAKESISKREAVSSAGLPVEIGRKAIDSLARHDIVSIEDDLMDFTVPLMRHWVMSRKLEKPDN